MIGDENKYDGEKTRLDLVEPSRYIAAAMRHFEAYRKGEKDDPESGMPHLWHCACNIMFLIEMEETKK